MTVPIKRADEDFSHVFYALSPAGNSAIEKTLDKLAKSDPESADYVAALIEKLESFGIMSPHNVRGVRNRKIGKLYELYVHPDCPKPLRILAARSSIGGCWIVVLIKIVDQHGGKTNKFPQETIRLAEKDADRILKWINEGGNINDL